MLKAALLYSFLLLCGIFFQGSVIGATLPSAILPDVMVVLAVCISLRYRSVRGLIGVYLLGLLADLGSGVYLGPNAAAGVVIFLATGVLANRVYAERVFAIVLISFVCSLLKSLTIVGLLLWYTNYHWDLTQLIRTLLFEASATALIAPLVVRLLPSVSGFGRSSKTSSSTATSSGKAWGSLSR